MIVDGVNFVDGACLKMTKEEFIEHHKDAFWLDRDEAVREQARARVAALCKKYPLYEEA